MMKISWYINDELSKQFYEWCQGADWKKVVDLNTQALSEWARKKIPLFVKPLETLSVPILFLGSLEDTMCQNDLPKEYEEMKELVSKGTIYLFKTGGHPAIATNAERSAKIIAEFINN